ncbi:MAG: DUF1129 domain-containing protein [Prevotellaceae bacterium]|jgi:hypothetical protein|nr:DUF1129 domain-containing protein [Prevotellaceae bacterium]
MTEILKLFEEIDASMTVFLMIFGLGIALFQTVILSSTYDLKFPGWLLFVVNPALIGVAYLIYKPLAGIVFALLFISIFILGIGGFFYSGIRGYIEDKRKEDKRNKKRTPWWKIILGLAGGLLFIAAFFSFGSYMFIFVFAFIIISGILPNPTNRFLQLQSVLPTSSIRSMAMGLVEVKGKIRKIEFLSAPIDSRQCIGYRYTVENMDKDKDGDTRYTTIKDVTVCNNFYIADDTGEVEVKGENLEFLWVKMSDRYSSGGKRHTQYLIQEEDEMLLIGKASVENRKTVIEKEDIRKIFMIAPAGSVNKWNKYKPLLKSLIVMTIVISVIAMFILLADVSLEGDTVHFHLKNIRFDRNELCNKF